MALAETAATENDYPNGGDEKKHSDNLEGQVEITKKSAADFGNIGVAGAG